MSCCRVQAWSGSGRGGRRVEGGGGVDEQPEQQVTLMFVYLLFKETYS